MRGVCGVARLLSLPDALTIDELLAGYRRRRFTPTQLIEHVLDRGDRAPERHVWIERRSRAELLTEARRLEQRPPDLPLYGVPFVVKDNIDLAAVPTTAACPDFSYVPEVSAAVVARLQEAGAIALGKTNLDQFATGLVGTRSPYGACRNPFNDDYIAGGSSSGSAVAVATGLASFALGTDTAGSGRVPAAFNNIVGLKPSLGRLSTRGVVPACRSLDCVSIFALTCEDAAQVLEIAQGFDVDDPFSRAVEDRSVSTARIGVPRPEQLEFFGDMDYARCFEATLVHLRALGATIRPIDLAPFLEAARLLYEGPWLAERYAAVGAFIAAHPDSVLPVTRRIIEAGRAPSAVQAFEAQYRLQAYRRACELTFNEVDVLLTPTAGTIYERARLEQEPVRLNANLGYYTNHMNLLDLTGVAVPAGFRADGLPFGITLAGRRGTERSLLALGSTLHRRLVTRLGAMAPSRPDEASDTISLAVCGAHMSGLALNHELLSRGGRLLRRTRTAPRYRLFALASTRPPRPGLVRVATAGAAIEVEVWSIPAAEVGSLAAAIPSPLGLGRIELEDAETPLGFLCEAHATPSADDITDFGGWRAYLDRRGA